MQQRVGQKRPFLLSGFRISGRQHVVHHRADFLGAKFALRDAQGFRKTWRLGAFEAAAHARLDWLTDPDRSGTNPLPVPHDHQPGLVKVQVVRQYGPVRGIGRTDGVEQDGIIARAGEWHGLEGRHMIVNHRGRHGNPRHPGLAFERSRESTDSGGIVTCLGSIHDP